MRKCVCLSFFRVKTEQRFDVILHRDVKRAESDIGLFLSKQKLFFFSFVFHPSEVGVVLDFDSICPNLQNMLRNFIWPMIYP